MSEVNPSNSICVLYGISGTGKSRQIDEAAEYVWETSQKVTRVYVSDLGGWGTKRLSLIRLGIVQVWYFVSHQEPWQTAELASLGWWPESFLDVETGLAAPDAPLVPPRQTRWTVKCPQGHAVETLTHEPVSSWAASCPTCQVMVSLANCLGIDKVTVRSKGFGRVGLYAYDSLTQLNESGMEVAAERGAGMQEGEALRSPAALSEGRFTFGLNAKTHYGFLQQRSRGWIRNIRTIPDQVERAIVTCGVEMGKGDDESGGIPIYGPKIAGNARTSSVPGWAGNCLHVTKETLADGSAKHRIWLVNHTDPRDPRAIPYLAKHRGEPQDMPQYLEDAPGAPPFSQCSMKEFYRLEKEQLAKVLERDQAKFGNAPGLLATEDAEEVLETTSASVVPQAVAVGGNGAPMRRRATAPPPTTSGTLVAPPMTGGTVVGSALQAAPQPTAMADPAGVGAVPRLRRVPRPPTT